MDSEGAKESNHLSLIIYKLKEEESCQSSLSLSFKLEHKGSRCSSSDDLLKCIFFKRSSKNIFKISDQAHLCCFKQDRCIIFTFQLAVICKHGFMS